MRPYLTNAPCGCDRQYELIETLQSQMAEAQAAIADMEEQLATVATMKAKLDTIASGAEVNVNADWNAITGDAQIYNKPTLARSSSNANFSVNGGGTTVVQVAFSRPSGATRILAIAGFAISGTNTPCYIRNIVIYNATSVNVTVTNHSGIPVNGSVTVYALWY